MAAAIAARHVALKHAKAKHTDQERLLEMWRVRDARESESVFDQIDRAGREPIGSLSRDQTRVLIQLVIGGGTVDEDGLNMVFPEAAVKLVQAPRRSSKSGSKYLAEASVGRPAKFPDAATKQQLVDGIHKYREYMAQRDEINDIFARFDTNGDLQLEREELRIVILESEAKLRKRGVSSGIVYEVPENERREVMGFTVFLEPTEKELDTILRVCDLNGDGAIGKSELIPALDLWGRLAEERIRKQQSFACCTVL